MFFKFQFCNILTQLDSFTKFDINLQNAKLIKKIKGKKRKERKRKKKKLKEFN